MDIEEAEPYAIMGGQNFLEQIDIPFFTMEFRIMAGTLRSQKPEDQSRKQTIYKMLELMGRKFYPTSISGKRQKISDVMIHNI